MVSSLLFVTLVFQIQGSSTAAGFRSPADVRQSSASPAEAPKNITAEQRGDIFMARKMYREELQASKNGPGGSPVLANKTGIAYHQMLDLEDARKYYERAVKLRPTYAEAINNLGTV